MLMRHIGCKLGGQSETVGTLFPTMTKVKYDENVEATGVINVGN